MALVITLARQNYGHVYPISTAKGSEGGRQIEAEVASNYTYPARAVL